MYIYAATSQAFKTFHNRLVRYQVRKLVAIKLALNLCTYLDVYYFQICCECYPR